MNIYIIHKKQLGRVTSPLPINILPALTRYLFFFKKLPAAQTQKKGYFARVGRIKQQYHYLQPLIFNPKTTKTTSTITSKPPTITIERTIITSVKSETTSVKSEISSVRSEITPVKSEITSVKGQTSSETQLNLKSIHI